MKKKKGFILLETLFAISLGLIFLKFFIPIFISIKKTSIHKSNVSKEQQVKYELIDYIKKFKSLPIDVIIKENFPHNEIVNCFSKKEAAISAMEYKVCHVLWKDVDIVLYYDDFFNI